MGALTSKPYAFNSRPWELQAFDSIDLGDSVGSNVRLDTRGSNILRVLPVLNEFLNEEWISDRVRFSYDGLTSQRLATPLVRKGSVAAFFSKVSWRRLFSELKLTLPLFDRSIDFLVGKTSSFESLALAKHVFQGSNFISEASTANSTDFQADYLFNSGYSDFLKADFFLIVGSNLRFEAPAFNLKVKRSLKLDPRKRVFVVGSGSVPATYSTISLGSLDTFLPKFYKGRHKISRVFHKALRPFLVVGESFDNSVFSNLLSFNTPFKYVLSGLSKWNGLNFLSVNASSNAFKDLSLGTSVFGYTNNNSSVKYLLNSDNIRFNDLSNLSIYQGYIGDWGASVSSIVIPTLHPYESASSTFINSYGKIQTIFRSQLSSADLVDDFTFFKYLGNFLNIFSFKLKPLSIFIGTLFSFRYFFFGVRVSNSLNWLLSLPRSALKLYSYISKRADNLKSIFLRSNDFLMYTGFVSSFSNSYHTFSFYLIDSVTRSSHIMALTHRHFRNRSIFV